MSPETLLSVILNRAHEVALKRLVAVQWMQPPNRDRSQAMGVEPDAAAKTITKACRRKAAEAHPDRNPGDSAAEERAREIE